MSIIDQLNIYLFSIGNQDILLSYILLSVLSAIALIVFFIFVKRHYLPNYATSRNLKPQERSRLINVFALLLILVWLTVSFLSFQLDFSIHQFSNGFDLRFSIFLKIFLLIQVASFINRLAIESIRNSYFSTERETSEKAQLAIKRFTRNIRTLIILLIVLILLNMLKLDYSLLSFKDTTIRSSGLLMAAVLLVGARVLGWILTEIILAGYYGRSQSLKLDEGNRYAINKLLSYFIYTLAFFFALSALGLNLTLFWGGTAALLVGVGLGLQQTFNDVFSGILLLFERSVEVGDWVEIETNIGGRQSKQETNVGRVSRIGLRTSVVKGRDDISVIVPNSLLVTQKVINWSHHDTRTRFSVCVSVAYGSDTDLVKQILEEVVNKHSRTLEKPRPKVRLIAFGENGLKFSILFWARNFYSIEDIKSDIRMGIDKAFRKNNITIPFPQRDIWTR